MAPDVSCENRRDVREQFNLLCDNFDRVPIDWWSPMRWWKIDVRTRNSVGGDDGLFCEFDEL